MATVTIRNVPDEVVQQLKVAAERRGRSMEAELRMLLSERYMAHSVVWEKADEIRANMPRFMNSEAIQNARRKGSK